MVIVDQSQSLAKKKQQKILPYKWAHSLNFSPLLLTNQI